MPENMKRKITVEPVSVKNKDSQAQRRPSVFERLGTKASSSSSSNPAPSASENTCRHWAQSGNCPYGKNCKYANTHALISPSKQRAAKKDVETKQKPGHPVSSLKANSSGPSNAKDEANKRLHSTIVIRKPHTGASPDLNWENWDQTDLEYEDEKVLEKRRQLLQRELELQMKREKDEQSKKVKKVKKGVSSSSSTSASSSSSTESSSSSDDSSSTSSSTSGDSRKKKTKPKSSKRDSSSSTSGTEHIAKKKANKNKSSDSLPTSANKKAPPPRKDDRILPAKRKDSPPKKMPLDSSKQGEPSGKKRSVTPPGRNRHRSQSPGSKDKPGGPIRPSTAGKKIGGKHTSPTPKRSQSVDRREKRNHSSSPRTSARDRERERERERERDKAKDPGRERSPKGKGRERAQSPRRDNRPSRDQHKKGSPDNRHSKEKGGRLSPKPRMGGSGVRPRENSLDKKSGPNKNSPNNARDREGNRGDPRDRMSDGKKSTDVRRDTSDKGLRAKEAPGDRNNSHRPQREDNAGRRDGDSMNNRDSGRKRDAPMLQGPGVKTAQDKEFSSKSDKDRNREPRDNREGRENRDNIDPRLSRGNKSLRDMKDAEREKEREEALERCKERQRERERKAREDKAREHERELPSLLLITTHNPIKNTRSGGREGSKGVDKVTEKGPERSRDRDRDRAPDRERGLDRAADRERIPDRGISRGADRSLDRDRGLNRSADRSLDRGTADRDRGSDRGLDRGLDRDRGGERERGFDRDRGLDRGPERDRTSDRSADRDRPLDRGLERDRLLDRGLPDRDRGLPDRDRGPPDRERGLSDRDRGLPDRERGLERGIERDRGPERDRIFDRGLDRVPMKGPPHDRSHDRIHDRGLNRGPSDRNFERGDRGFERDVDRDMFDRDNREDPGYPLPPRGRDDKDYDSPYDSRRGRDDRSRYGDQLERGRYDEPPLREDTRRLGPDARSFPDERRGLIHGGRGRDGRDSLEPVPWEGRGRIDRERDLHDRDSDRRRPPYDREEVHSPVTSLKDRDWDARDYPDSRREWDGRGMRRGPPPDWDVLHRGEWLDKEGPPLDAEWDLYGPGGQGDWPPSRDRWGDEWEHPVRPSSRLPPRITSHSSEYLLHPEDLPPPPVDPLKEIKQEPVEKLNIKEEAVTPTRKADVPDVPSLKRPRESDGEGERPEKKFCPEEVVPLEPEDLSDISDDDADEILNREDVELANTVTAAEQASNQQPNSSTSQPPMSNDSDKGLGREVNGLEKLPESLNAEANRESADQNSLLQQDDEATLDQLDFEEISDEELEEEARAGLGDALGVDWASLVAETRPRVRANAGQSARRRWEGLRMLARLGVSVDYAGQEMVDELTAKIKVMKDEDKENNKSAFQDEDDEFSFLHPVALIHVAWQEKRERRKALFASVGPFTRALSARRDLLVRRQLCNLPINETSVEIQGQNSDEIFRLAVQLFERE